MYLELQVGVSGVEVVGLLGLGVEGGGCHENLLDLVSHQEPSHVEVVAGHVHEDPAAVLQVGHRWRRRVAAGDVDGAHFADGTLVDLFIIVQKSQFRTDTRELCA